MVIPLGWLGPAGVAGLRCALARAQPSALGVADASHEEKPEPLSDGQTSRPSDGRTVSPSADGRGLRTVEPGGVGMFVRLGGRAEDGRTRCGMGGLDSGFPFMLGLGFTRTGETDGSRWETDGAQMTKKEMIAALVEEGGFTEEEALGILVDMGEWEAE